MKPPLLILSTPLYTPPPTLPFFQSLPFSTKIYATAVEQTTLTAKERRKLRNERRESKAGLNNWKEEVEERLLEKPKKRYENWKEELNLDNLAELGPQWWCVRVSRVHGHETAERLARFLARHNPDLEFKVYAPAVHVKRKLKNGTISVKPKPLFPGCIFLRCVLNKELHDITRECPGIGGFIGSRVGKTKRQINRPKPVSKDDIEAMFLQAKEEQEQADQAFREDQQREELPKKEDVDINSIDNVLKSISNPKQKRRTKKGIKAKASNQLTGADDKLLIPGTGVRVVSGSFSEFKGNLKKLDSESGKATVGFMLFGKESFIDVDVNQIVAEA